VSGGKSTGKKVIYISAIVGVIIIVLAGLAWWNFRLQRVTDLPTVAPAADVPPVTSVAKNLEIPWALDFLPDGSIIFTERPGRVRLIDAREGLLSEPLLTLSEVAHRGEGGLLGIAVHPDFTQNKLVYIYHTYEEDGVLANPVVKFRMQGRTLDQPELIISGIPGASNHNGGRIKFGPDGFLYITTGDARVPELSQDRDSLAGKILRLKDDGTIPADNPFSGSAVYSLGHRNPQGLAWDDQGRLWATEHGSSATDELNLIEPGKNYGWPVIRGDERAEGMETPVRHSGRETWAPSGATFWGGSIFFAGLRGQSLFEAVIEDGTVTLVRHLDRNFGRLRTVVAGPGNFLYLMTNNRDGRGVPTEDDDQIVRINPGKL
jgi:glucose/arabinose dehydrogenase